MTAQGRTPRIIWIFQNGEKRYRVFPSPVNVAPGEEVLFKNWTKQQADLSFDPSLRISPFRLGPRNSGAVTIPAGTDSDYYEYEVKVNGANAEGCSPPGFIVDP